MIGYPVDGAGPEHHNVGVGRELLGHVRWLTSLMNSVHASPARLDLGHRFIELPVEAAFRLAMA
jgi:hypothetical protein